MRKSKEYMDNRLLLSLKYKWEFMRRNKDYRRDCAIMAGLNDKQFSQDERVFIHKWDILEPINPDMSFNNLVKSNEKKKAWYLDTLQGCTSGVLDAYILDKEPDRYVLDWAREVDIRVNFFASKSRLIFEFEKQIDKWKKRIRQAWKNEKLYIRNPRARIDQYDRYLQVFDLRSRGLTWDRIAKDIYKSDVERGDINYAQRKVKRDYARCQTIIEGGYRQIE